MSLVDTCPVYKCPLIPSSAPKACHCDSIEFLEIQLKNALFQEDVPGPSSSMLYLPSSFQERFCFSVILLPYL